VWRRGGRGVDPCLLTAPKGTRVGFAWDQPKGRRVTHGRWKHPNVSNTRPNAPRVVWVWPPWCPYNSLLWSRFGIAAPAYERLSELKKELSPRQSTREPVVDPTISFFDACLPLGTFVRPLGPMASVRCILHFLWDTNDLAFRLFPSRGLPIASTTTASSHALRSYLSPETTGATRCV